MIYQDPRKKAILIKFDGTPTSSEAIKLCENILFTPEFKKNTGNCVGDGKGETKETTVARDATTKATIKTVVRTPSSAGQLPTIDNLLQMSGLVSVVDSDNNTVTYSKADVFDKTGTIVDYTDDEKRVIEGVLADFTMEFTKGEAVSISFDVSGKMDVIPTIEANPTDIVLDTGRKYFVDCITVTDFDGGTLELNKATFKLGNEIKESGAFGSVCEVFYVGKRESTLSVEDDKEKGNLQYWNDLVDGTKRALSIEMTDYVTSQKFKLDISAMSYEDVGESIKDSSRVGTTRNFNVDNFSLIYS